MSEKTPVGRAAEAIQAAARARAAHVSDRLADEFARATLAAAVEDRDGLARVLERHWLTAEREPYRSTAPVRRACACGQEYTPEYFEWRHFEQHNKHQADAVARWLTGGGA